jgi:hypothetical protein
VRHAPLKIALGVLAVFCLGPAPGDIGGCGQEAQLLDAERFFATKRGIDCAQCGECSLDTARCSDACDPGRPLNETFPERCLPLVHDGEVCLRALLFASCGSYAEFMDDEAPRVPTECNFCPPEDE